MKKVIILIAIFYWLTNNLFAQVSFSANKTCIGDTTEFTINNNSSSTIDSVLWDFGVTTVTSDSSTQMQVAKYKYSLVTNYNVKLYYYVSGIVDSVENIITINPLPTVDLGGDQTVCNGTTYNLTTSQNFQSYYWSDSSTNSSLNVTTDGTYSVIATDNNACKNTDTVKISFEGPTLNLNQSANICAGASSTTLDGGSGYNSYQWSSGDNTQTTQVSSAGDYILTVYDTIGCSASDTITVTDVQGPQLTSYEQTPVSTIANGFAILYASGGNGSLMYSLLQTAAYQNSNQFSHLSEGIYTATVKDDNGCTDSLEIEILNEKDPVEPSDGFSPNQDGVNESWIINKIGIYPKAIVRVYDRYGKLMYESKGNYKPWDGTDAKGFVPSGTYYYYIDLQNDNKPQVGFLTIFR